MKSAKFSNFSILTETDYRFQRNKIEETKNSGDKTQCSRTLHTVTDKIGSRQRPNEEAKHRDEYRSRRFSESVIRMSFKDAYTGSSSKGMNLSEDGTQIIIKSHNVA